MDQFLVNLRGAVRLDLEADAGLGLGSGAAFSASQRGVRGLDDARRAAVAVRYDQPQVEGRGYVFDKGEDRVDVHVIAVVAEQRLARLIRAEEVRPRDVRLLHFLGPDVLDELEADGRLALGPKIIVDEAVVRDRDGVLPRLAVRLLIVSFKEEFHRRPFNRFGRARAERHVAARVDDFRARQFDKRVGLHRADASRPQGAHAMSC
mmetsp:Transcript_3118/g.9327  ORF Transcript_3118/g.9327 Transcript_3118/m.9327 type:complete len:206 (-) Transcript_3118:325-942(-)